jgi:hypothetical protein
MDDMVLKDSEDGQTMTRIEKRIETVGIHQIDITNSIIIAAENHNPLSRLNGKGSFRE